MLCEHLTMPNEEVALVLFTEYIDGVAVAQWKRTYLKHENLHSDDEDDDDEAESGMSADLCSSSMEGEFEALKFKPERGLKLFYCVLEAVKQIVRRKCKPYKLKTTASSIIFTDAVTITGIT